MSSNWKAVLLVCAAVVLQSSPSLAVSASGQCPVKPSRDQCRTLRDIFNNQNGSQVAHNRWQEVVLGNIVQSVAEKAKNSPALNADECRKYQTTAACKAVFDLRCATGDERRNPVHPWFDRLLTNKITSSCPQ